MKKLFCCTLPLLALTLLSNNTLAIGINIDPVDEMVVTASPFPVYSPPPVDQGFGNTANIYGGGGGRGAAIANAKAKACANADTNFAQCKRNAQNIYLSATKNCGRITLGGSTMGAGGLGAAAALFTLGSNPYGWGLLAIGALGTGAGVWGSSSCYNGPAAVRDTNLSICDNNLAKVKQLCGQ